MAEMSYDQLSMAELASQRGVHPVELMIDLSLEHDFDIFFRQPIANENQDHVLEMMKHPRSVVTFSDSGAHVAQIMDSSLQTHLLSYWVRGRQAFTLEEAVRKLTFDNASAWELADRGLVRTGFAADLVLFDLERPWRIDPEGFRSKSKNSPFDDHPVQGRVLRTIVDGRTIYQADHQAAENMGA